MPRPSTPTRSANVAQRARYGDYKPQLRIDFEQCCGYCGDSDRFYGGLHGYHVEHFAPKSKFPHLETAYPNLIYGCPYCNRGKSNKWIGDDAAVPHNGAEGFVDPCSEEFDDHLDRDGNGNFVALSPVGEFMIRHLKLYLERHRYIWTIQRMKNFAARAERLRTLLDKSDTRYLQLLELIADLHIKIEEYNDSVFGVAT
jgi:hypothetical protein